MIKFPASCSNRPAARECHCSNKDSGNQITSKSKPSVWIAVEHPALGVFVRCIVEVFQSGLLSLANPDSGKTVKGVRNVRVDRAARWSGRRSISCSCIILSIAYHMWVQCSMYVIICHCTFMLTHQLPPASSAQLLEGHSNTEDRIKPLWQPLQRWACTHWQLQWLPRLQTSGAVAKGRKQVNLKKKLVHTLWTHNCMLCKWQVSIHTQSSMLDPPCLEHLVCY